MYDLLNRPDFWNGEAEKIIVVSIFFVIGTILYALLREGIPHLLSKKRESREKGHV